MLDSLYSVPGDSARGADERPRRVIEEYKMTVGQAIALFAAAVVGGTLNAVAGGGSFVTFPMLIFSGVPPVQANATSTVALWPGAVASAGAYRSALDVPRQQLVVLAAASIAGGAIGALLLLHTSQTLFLRLVPILLLAATLLFTFGGTLTARLRKRLDKPAKPEHPAIVSLGITQFIIATYGGFYGGGIGILMLATFSVAGMDNIHAMNGLRSLLASCINGVAVITFILAGAIYWPQALVMVLGAVLGGYGGASVARRLDPLLVRRFVIAVGVVMTAYFFLTVPR